MYGASQISVLYFFYLDGALNIIYKQAICRASLQSLQAMFLTAKMERLTIARKHSQRLTQIVGAGGPV